MNATVLLLVLAVIECCAASWTDDAGTPMFFSRPDLNTPVLDVRLHGDEVEPGNIFVSPYFGATRKPDSGPYIFDNAGMLVWSGLDDCNSAGTSDTHGLHVCQYLGEDHLCFWKGRQRGIHGNGVGIVMNTHYEVVKTVKPSGTWDTVDLHEFRLTAQGTALITAYRPRLHGSIWILDSLFYEIDLATDQVLFQWSAMDHVRLSESRTLRGAFGSLGDGTSSLNAWDFFHINSIDQNDAGDYLISSRHTDTILKIARDDGRIVWRLNGDRSSFQLVDFTFARQHDARFLEDTEARTVISVFNNDNDGFTVHGSTATGIVVEIDHVTKSAQRLLRLDGPISTGLTSDGMGSMSYLSTGNAFVSYGADSAMAEYSPDGTPIWYARIGWESRNYRAYKSHWVGEPLQPPTLWTSSNSFNSPAISHVSWNGATQVHRWRLYSSHYENEGYEIVASVDKNDFETHYQYDLYWPWTFAEALDVHGNSLANSTKTRTVDLSIVLADECGPSACLAPAKSHGHGKSAFDKGGAERCAQASSHRKTFSSWMYVEHLFAAVGGLTFIVAGLWASCGPSRRSRQYHLINSQNV